MKASSIRITILADNTAAEGLSTEHGFSLWIEAGGAHILFDAGQSDVFVKNAQALGIPIPEALRGALENVRRKGEK